MLHRKKTDQSKTYYLPSDYISIKERGCANQINIQVDHKKFLIIYVLCVIKQAKKHWFKTVHNDVSSSGFFMFHRSMVMAIHNLHSREPSAGV
jgi:hypothetical protein